jgi:hypothetical protein
MVPAATRTKINISMAMIEFLIGWRAVFEGRGYID